MKPLNLLLFLGFSFAACQRVVPLKPYSYQSPRRVLVQGSMFYASDTIPILGFRAVFTRELKDRTIEQASDAAMPKTGRYQVRLLPGKTYQVALFMGDCRVETQEFAVSHVTSDTILTKSFYMHYPDSTDYSGCLAGWHPYQRPIRTAVPQPPPAASRRSRQ